MKLRAVLVFAAQTVGIGLIAAILLLIFLPEGFFKKRPVVEFLEHREPAAGS